MRIALPVLLLVSVACGPVGENLPSDGGATDGGEVTGDGGDVLADAGVTEDAGTREDAGDTDGGPTEDAGTPEDGGTDPLPDAGQPVTPWTDSCGHSRPDLFADEVVSFTPGANAGFGQDSFPCIVLGPPLGKGPTAGSLDVLSLGNAGNIVLKFADVQVVDGPGPDLIVFENPFPGWLEPGFVAVSDDGQDWHEWPCEAQNADGGYPHCAGIHPTLSNPTNGVSANDPAVAGGDAFDFAELGVTQARYVRIRDSGAAHYGGVAGGFDLDAVAAVHSEPVAP